MSSQSWWYVARASGILAWLMLAASVTWGILLATRAFPRSRRPAWLLDLHRFLGGLAISFVAIHLAALVADRYVHFDAADLLIPYASSWKPGALAFGVVAMWLLAAVQLSSLAIKRLPRGVWHGVHLVSYAVFWLTSIHAALAGTDRSRVLYRATAAGSITVVAAALVYRLLRPAPRRSPHTGRSIREPTTPLAGG